MFHKWKHGLHHLNAHKMLSFIISGQFVGQICNSRGLFLPVCQQNLDGGGGMSLLLSTLDIPTLHLLHQ